MKHIKVIASRNLCESAKKGGCGECQTSCQSACKTSCGIANQKCENSKESKQFFLANLLALQISLGPAVALGVWLDALFTQYLQS